MKLLPPQLVAALTAFAAVVVIGASAEAQTVTVNRCAAAKIRCVMGYTHVCGVAGVLGLFKCHQNATTRARFIDQVCVNRTTDKITDCFRDAERQGDCLTTGDVVGIQEKIEDFVLDAVNEINPVFPYPISNACVTGKEKGVAEATAAKLECFEDAFRRAPGVVDESCFAKPEAKFSYRWAKLEDNGGCLTSDDDGLLQEKLDAFVADIVASLNP
jgi:hypothetical protein